MPIYGYGVIGAPWTICREIDKKTLFIMINKFIENQDKIKCFDKESFIKTIEYNIKMEECYIGTYDIAKSNINEYNYMKCMEELLKIMNSIYEKKKYKFDIVGQWTAGKIVIMVKK